MEAVFHNKRITGILGILPEKTYQFFDEMEGGDSPRNQKIAKNMGYRQRYRVNKGTTTGDLCVYGLKHLLDKDILSEDEIGAIIVVSFTPDYFVPHISNVIQGSTDIPKDILTMDIWDGCAGYISGLYHAFMYLDQIKDKKVLLFTGDVINRVDKEGEVYSLPPYGGDGAAITIVENSEDNNSIPVMIEADGSHRDLVTFYEGAFYDMYHENKMNRELSQNDPNASFRYFQSVVPEMVEKLMIKEKISKEEIDQFFFVQANQLSVKKFADTLNLPYEKVRMNLVEEYGDMSATLNPIGIVDELQDDIGSKSYKSMIVGYGAGVKWGATVLNIEKGTYLEMIRSDL